MATKVSSDAQKVLSGVSQTALNTIMSQAQGSKLTSGEASRLLEQFKVTGDPYSTANVVSTSQGVTPKPDLSDPLALRQYYLDQMGVPTALTKLQDIQSRLNAFDTSTEQTLNAIENKPVRMGVITGEEAATERSRATTRNSLAREQLATQSFLDAARQEAETRFGIANQDRSTLQQMIVESGGNAGITFGDSISEASKKLADYKKKEQKRIDEESRKRQEKDALKSTATTLGIKTKGKSSSELRKAIEKIAKKDKDAENALKDLELKLKKKELAKPYSSDGSGDKLQLQFDKDMNDIADEIGNKFPTRDEAAAAAERRYPGDGARWIYRMFPDQVN